MLDKLRRIFLYSDVINKDTLDAQEKVLEDNRKFAVAWSAAQILYWGYCIVMSFSSEDFHRCRSAYIAAIILCVAALICAARLAPKAPRLIPFTEILTVVALLGASLWIARIQLRHNAWTLMMFASVLLFPIMFINVTLSNILVAGVNFLAAVIMLRDGIKPEVSRWSLTNLLIFSSIGILVGHFIDRARYERYVFAESAVKLAEMQTKFAYYDQMTGLKNRRAYSEKLDELAKGMPADLCVVMADLNGLKRANDTMGHEAGDELIIGASECLSQAFDGAGTVYRIGGDEFCVIMERTLPEAMHCLERLAEVSSGWKGRFINGVSLSCGVETNQDCTDIEAIVKEADRKMYAEKSNYYRNSGIDRRRR